ncbi:sensor histidine kinase [Gryllotalpicola koreensis]
MSTGSEPSGAARTRAVSAIALGLARSAAFAGTAAVIPAAVALLPVLAALNLVGTRWSWNNLWSWFALGVIIVAVTGMLAHPVAVLFRIMLTKWAGLELACGYRSTLEPVRLSTGFWWNGSSYERSREDAEQDLRWRRMLEPAFRREVRWATLAATVILPVCGIPIGALVAAALMFRLATGPSIVAGGLLVVVAFALAPFAWRFVGPLAQRWLAAPTDPVLSPADLRAQRADLMAAHDAEVRRIERDLHDGAQSRITAVGLDLAAAERLMATDLDRARQLLRSARLGTAQSLQDLRDLVHGVYPPVLIERGLIPAVRALALDSPVLVDVAAPRDLPRLPSPLEAAVYFAAAELLSNVARHSGATEASIRIEQMTHTLEVEIADDGIGDADVRAGGGLDGVRRRLNAFEGTLRVDSPPGGPTRVRVTVPCE